MLLSVVLSGFVGAACASLGSLPSQFRSRDRYESRQSQPYPANTIDTPVCYTFEVKLTISNGPYRLIIFLTSIDMLLMLAGLLNKDTSSTTLTTSLVAQFFSILAAKLLGRTAFRI
jgi:hypothetical protein